MEGFFKQTTDSPIASAYMGKKANATESARNPHVQLETDEGQKMRGVCNQRVPTLNVEACEGLSETSYASTYSETCIWGLLLLKKCFVRMT